MLTWSKTVSNQVFKVSQASLKVAASNWQVYTYDQKGYSKASII